MATLKTQILADLRTVLPSATLVDLTNQRDTDSSENTDITERAAAYADAVVRGHLNSDVTGEDLEAVSIGVDLAIINLSKRFNLGGTGTDGPTLQDTMTALKALQRRRRIANTSPILYSPDYTAVDRLYPITRYEDEV